MKIYLSEKCVAWIYSNIMPRIDFFSFARAIFRSLSDNLLIACKFIFTLIFLTEICSKINVIIFINVLYTIKTIKK